jgi:hypothetical protein
VPFNNNANQRAFSPSATHQLFHLSFAAAEHMLPPILLQERESLEISKPVVTDADHFSRIAVLVSRAGDRDRAGS